MPALPRKRAIQFSDSFTFWKHVACRVTILAWDNAPWVWLYGVGVFSLPMGKSTFFFLDYPENIWLFGWIRTQRRGVCNESAKTIYRFSRFIGWEWHVMKFFEWRTLKNELSVNRVTFARLMVNRILKIWGSSSEVSVWRQYKLSAVNHRRMWWDLGEDGVRQSLFVLLRNWFAKSDGMVASFG